MGKGGGLGAERGAGTLNSEGLDATLRMICEQVDRVLRDLLFEPDGDIPAPLREAMEYACFPGGKRLRPVLAVLSCRAHGGTDDAVLPAAAALEMIHCYSLVHDDLPAMDDDDLRRGRPTCHKVFGDAMAILAGDALLTRAFEVISSRSRPEHAAGLTREVARAAGAHGMVGGQAADLLGEGQAATEAAVSWIHRHKTGELIRASVRVGAIAADASEEQLEAADRYGRDLGMAFQIVDDLLGRTGAEAVTGKPVGKDDARGKLTYPAAVGEPRARQMIEELTDRALTWADSFPHPGDLRELAMHLRERVA